MNQLKKLLVMLAALIFAAPVSAHFMDGNWVHGICQVGLDEQRFAECPRYISGVMDGGEAVNNKLYCWPEEARLGQAVDIVKKWLEENPALRTMSGGSIVVSALKEAFPTKVMWRPPQRDENGIWALVPLTPGKSSEEGEWVASCNGDYRYDFDDVLPFVLRLPENYKFRQAWFDELLNGPE